jgi:hypothetical protein
MSKFEVNVPDARVKNWIPKLAKDEDASRSGELQLENVRILPRAAAALLLAQDGGSEVVDAFFRGSDHVQRFWGIGEIVMSRELVKFAGKHKMRIDDLSGDIRVDSIDKFRLRFEGGPQQHIWADFSIFLDDVSDEETAYLHWHIHRDIALVLEQADDLVDKMIAAAQNMSVSTTVANGELDLDDQAARDKANADAVAAAMTSSHTAEVPLRGVKRKPAKKSSSRKASGKSAPTRKAG